MFDVGLFWFVGLRDGDIEIVLKWVGAGGWGCFFLVWAQFVGVIVMGWVVMLCLVR